MRDVKATIQRKNRKIGIRIDRNGVIDRIVEGSAAGEHGDIKVGQRIISIDGEPFTPGHSIMPYFEKWAGNQLHEFQLVLMEPLEEQAARPVEEQAPAAAAIPAPVAFDKYGKGKESAWNFLPMKVEVAGLAAAGAL
jgi:hypothetical protein